MPQILKLKNIHKKFQHRHVLKALDLQIPEGQRCALLGKNGSGKSTLLKIIAGIMQAMRGEGEFLGEIMFGEDGRYRRRMTYLSHSPQLYPALSLAENLALYFQLRGESPSSNDIQSELEKFGLWAHRHKNLRSYSAGMLQRIQLVKLSIADWHLALLDEPTNALDISAVEILETLMQQWQSQGRSILFSGHAPRWVARNADRVCLLSGGKIMVDSAEFSEQSIVEMLR